MAFLSICWLIIIAFVIVGVTKKTKKEKNKVILMVNGKN